MSLEEELEQKSHQLMDKQKQATTCKVWRIQGRGPGPAPPPPLLVLDQTEARRAEKIFWGDCPSPTPLSKGLYDRPPPTPPLCKGLDPALVSTEYSKELTVSD